MLNKYKIPSDEILKIHTQNKGFNIIMSTDMSNVIIAETILYPSILSRINNIGKIAGDRYYIDTGINIDHQFYKSIEVITEQNKKSYELHGKCVSNIKFGFDNNYFTYCSYNLETNKNQLVIQYIDDSSLYDILDADINMLCMNPYELSTTDDTIYFLQRSTDYKNHNIDDNENVIEPIIKISEKNNPIPQRTFPDVLINETDCIRFKNLLNSKLVKYSVYQKNTSILFTDCVKTFEINKFDGNILFEAYTSVSTLVYSDYFGFDVKLFNIESNVIHLIKNIPLEPSMMTLHDATHRYARGFSWLCYKNKQYIMYIIPEDGGNPSNKTKHMDNIVLFDLISMSEISLTKCKYRVSSIMTDTLDGIILIETSDKQKHSIIRRLQFSDDLNLLSDIVLFNFDTENLYDIPGSFITVKNKYSENVLVDSDNYIYMRSPGYSQDGVYPHIYKFNIDSKDKIILWKCSNNRYENIFYHNVVFPGYLTFMYSTQTTNISPSYKLKHIYLKKNIANNSLEKSFREYRDNHYKFRINDVIIMPSQISYDNISGYIKSNIKYNRADNIGLSATLYTPKNYQKGTYRPIIIIAYPKEFNNEKNVGQIRSSDHIFNHIRGISWLYFLAKGYIIVEDCDMPIIKSNNKEANDTFIEQLDANAKAIIDYLILNGYSNGKNIAVVGHSYGAFMVANLLTHTKYFTCGIARSGAYNRTLTPFGFQGEDRTLWEASETYLKMSPILYANKINSPILLIHGQQDPNPGTYPIQSERYFEALKGLGADAELVILPGESHGYECEESILHTIAVSEQWFEKWFDK